MVISLKVMMVSSISDYLSGLGCGVVGSVLCIIVLVMCWSVK